MFATAEKAPLNGKARAIHRTAAKATRRVEDDMEDATSTIFEAANAIKEDVEELAQNAGRRVREVIDSTEGSVAEVTNNVTSTIRENAIQSSLIALGVGVLVGLMMRRSSN